MDIRSMPDSWSSWQEEEAADFGTGKAERLEVARSRVSNMVNSMNEKGLVDQAADFADGRVRLKPAGRGIVEWASALQKQMQATILEKLDPADRSRVISGLELLCAAMHEAKAEMAAGSTGSASGFNQADEVDG